MQYLKVMHVILNVKNFDSISGVTLGQFLFVWPNIERKKCSENHFVKKKEKNHYLSTCFTEITHFGFKY